MAFGDENNANIKITVNNEQAVPKLAETETAIASTGEAAATTGKQFSGLSKVGEDLGRSVTRMAGEFAKYIVILNQLSAVHEEIKKTFPGFGAELMKLLPAQAAIESLHSYEAAWLEINSAHKAGATWIAAVNADLQKLRESIPYVGELWKHYRKDVDDAIPENARLALSLSNITRGLKENQAELESWAQAAKNTADPAFEGAIKDAEALAEQLRGPSVEALKEHDAALLLSISGIEKLGTVNAQTHDAIVKALTEEAAKYTDWGKVVPAALQAAIDKYGALTKAADDSTKAILDGLTKQEEARRAEQQAAAGAGMNAADPSGNVRDLQSQIDQLNNQPYLTNDQEQQLETLTDKLFDAKSAAQDYETAQAQMTQSITDSLVPATEVAKNKWNDLLATLGPLSQETLGQKLGPAVEGINKNLHDLETSSDGIKISTDKATDAVRSQADAYDKNSDAIQGLTASTDNYDEVARRAAQGQQELGKAAEDSTKKQTDGQGKVQELLKEQKNSYTDIEKIQVRMNEEHLPNMKVQLKEILDLMGQLG